MKILIVLLLSLNAHASTIVIDNSKTPLSHTAIKNKIESIMERLNKEVPHATEDYEFIHLCDGRYEGPEISRQLDEDIVDTCKDIGE